MAEFSREMKASERSAIRKLVKSTCSNFSTQHGCIPLDCECYMLTKRWTGCFCKWFQEAVLPNDPSLIALLSDVSHEQECVICGKDFIKAGKRIYCSKECSRQARLKRQRGYMKKYEGKL